MVDYAENNQQGFVTLAFFYIESTNFILLITGSSLISHNTLKEWDMRYFQINQNKISLLESGHSSMATDGNI